MEIFLLVLAFLVGFAIGAVAAFYYIRYALKKQAEAAMAALANDVPLTAFLEMLQEQKSA